MYINTMPASSRKEIEKPIDISVPTVSTVPAKSKEESKVDFSVEASKILRHLIPREVHLILMDKMCLCMSDYGLNSLLTLYFMIMMDVNERKVAVTVHIYLCLRSIVAIIGSFLADAYFGKYVVISLASILHILGMLTLSIAAAVERDIPSRYILFIAMALLTLGFGGLFGCMVPFAGDQFKSPEQMSNVRVLFNLYYFNLQGTELLAVILFPVLTSSKFCFRSNCYLTAFSVSTIFTIIGFGIFLLGSGLYYKIKPSHPFPIEGIKCILHGLKNFLRNICKSRNRRVKKTHWLDYADDKYSPELIEDTRRALKVILIPMVTFWCLHDQKSTTWTLQASRMDCKIGPLEVNPGQVQCLHPLMLLLLVPTFHWVIYPFLGRYKILQTVLQRMTLGGFFMVLAYVAAQILEYELEQTYPMLPELGYCEIRIYNGLHKPVAIEMNSSNIFKVVDPYEMVEFLDVPVPQNNLDEFITVEMGFQVATATLVTIQEGETFPMIIDLNDENEIEVRNLIGYDNLEKSLNGDPKVRIICASNCSNVELSLTNEEIEWSLRVNISKTADRKPQERVKPGKLLMEAHRVPAISLIFFRYLLEVNGVPVKDQEFRLGGVYTLLVYYEENRPWVKLFILTPPNTLSVLWMIPQYILMSVGTTLYVLSSQIFIYTEAPENIKSFTWCWTYINAGSGNFMAAVITNIMGVKRSTVFLMFAGMMLVNLIFFVRVTKNYKYKDKDGHIRSLLGL